MIEFQPAISSSGLKKMTTPQTPESLRKQCLVLNIVNFLQDELIGGNLNDEHKESVEVAIQCLETAFDLANCPKEVTQSEKVDLLHHMPDFQPEPSEEAKTEAEGCKSMGNALMRNGNYDLAIEEYSKAIQLNPKNAIYYCNRAAAYSRVDRHGDCVIDCKEAIKLDPTYSKAYSRLGIAYFNLNNYELACQAHRNALKYDPGNVLYENNLKLAEDKLAEREMGSSATPRSVADSLPEGMRPDLSSFLNNPQLINMASQMLNDPSIRNMMSGILGSTPADGNFDALLQAGQTLASRLQTTDPAFVENLRRNFASEMHNQGSATNSTNSDTGNNSDNTGSGNSQSGTPRQSDNNGGGSGDTGGNTSENN